MNYYSKERINVWRFTFCVRERREERKKNRCRKGAASNERESGAAHSNRAKIINSSRFDPRFLLVGWSAAEIVVNAFAF